MASAKVQNHKLLGRWCSKTTSVDPPCFTCFVQPELQAALRKMGIVSPNVIQDEALTIAMSGRDALIRAQTGSGKTLMFMLPLLQSFLENAKTLADGHCAQPEGIILVPTRELAIQNAIVATELVADLPEPPIIARLNNETSSVHQARLIVSTPEQLMTGLQSGAVRLDNLKMVAIDEVDAVLCGAPHDTNLTDTAIHLLEELQSDSVQFLMATAHLQQEHKAGIMDRFPRASVVQQSGHSTIDVLVPTLQKEYHYFSGGKSSKDSKLLDVLRNSEEDAWINGGSTMVFCSNVENVEGLHALLQKEMPHMRPQVNCLLQYFWHCA
jgi:superfamily II DNA/RNA helicase